MEKNKKLGDRGITLIALIVTIIVLLILAGVSIAVLTGENGILNRATEAKNTNEEAEIMENIRLAFNNAQIGKYAGKNENFVDTMKSDLEKTYGTGESNVKVEDTENNTYRVTIKGKKYTIAANGNVTKVEGFDISSTSLNLQKRIGGTTAQTTITATKDGVEGTVNWALSQSEEVVSISGTTGDSIKVTPLKAGSATITVTCANKTKQCAITVVEVSKVTVTFNLNGGSVDNSTENITRQEFPGDTIDTLPEPTKENYTFGGWYENDQFTGSAVTEITVPSSNKTYYAKWAEPALTYGAPANLGTVTVGSTALLKGWKYFYNDGTNIYLIYENYLESAQIPSGTNISNDGYNVFASGNRNNLINYLNDESTSTSGTWSGFAKGVQDALAAKDITVEVKAKGAPTLEQFAGSYQANYPLDYFDVAYRQSGGYINGTSGNTVDAEGYVYKKGSSWNKYQNLGNSNKALYFPETTYSGIRDANASPAQGTDTYGYWLAGLSAYNSNSVCYAYFDGGANGYDFNIDRYGVRPVVSIPKSDNLMSKLGLK